MGRLCFQCNNETTSTKTNFNQIFCIDCWFKMYPNCSRCNIETTPSTSMWVYNTKKTFCSMCWLDISIQEGKYEDIQTEYSIFKNVELHKRGWTNKMIELISSGKIKDFKYAR